MEEGGRRERREMRYRRYLQLLKEIPRFLFDVMKQRSIRIKDSECKSMSTTILQIIYRHLDSIVIAIVENKISPR